MNSLCITSFGKPGDPKVWSGTPAKVIDYFNSINSIRIETLDLRKLAGNTYRASQLVGKVLYRRGTLRDPFLYKIESSRFDKETYKHDVNAYLFIAEHAVGEKKNPNCKYYLYLDSLLRPYFIYDERKFKPGAKWFLKHYEENDKKCFQQYDGIMTQNQWSKDFLISEYRIDEKKIHNIGFGINASFYEGEKDYSLKQLMIVLRKGTEYVKGLYLLLDAFEIAHKKEPNLKLAVFGTQDRKVDGVEYYYNTPRELMLDMYKKSTLYVMPNVLEPNGITYLEAMASKTPIVGLNRFSVPEFTGDGKYGFIAEKADADSLSRTILYAISDTDRLKKMGEEGQLFVKDRYKWDKVFEKMKMIIFQ